MGNIVSTEKDGSIRIRGILRRIQLSSVNGFGDSRQNTPLFGLLLFGVNLDLALMDGTPCTFCVQLTKARVFLKLHIFSPHIKFSSGNGSISIFQPSFPRILNISLKKYWRQFRISSYPQFGNSIFGEILEVKDSILEVKGSSLLSIVSPLYPYPSRQDSRLWTLFPSGSFLVSSFLSNFSPPSLPSP